MSYQKILEQVIAGSGVTFNGTNPWDPQIKDPLFHEKVVKGGTVALGESYMHGGWNCDQIDELFYRVLLVQAKDKLPSGLGAVLRDMYTKFVNLQTRYRSLAVGKKHYDAGNDLYKQMLDSYMTYTCAYWDAGAQSLLQAQMHKLKMVCEKLRLPAIDTTQGRKRLRILDIGCGWGSFARYAVEHYNVHVVGVTISNEQLDLAKVLCAGKPIDLRFQDYRDVNDEPFDAVVSLGMFEHVGPKNYREYFETVHRLLKPGGLFLLHTIGGMHSVTDTDPWIEKYIFANSVIPSSAQIANASEGLLVERDFHNFGRNYDRTLMEWYKNINAQWPEGYDEVFRRMWNYYLLTCAATFRAEYNHLFQIVFSKGLLEKPYKSVRYDAIIA